MVLTQFRVRIANIRCTDLPQPSAGKSTNAYCKVSEKAKRGHRAGRKKAPCSRS